MASCFAYTPYLGVSTVEHLVIGANLLLAGTPKHQMPRIHQTLLSHMPTSIHIGGILPIG